MSYGIEFPNWELNLERWLFSSAAVPPDVRKVSGFPQLTFLLVREAMPRRKVGHTPGGNFELDRKGEAFPHIRRQSRGTEIGRDKFSRQALPNLLPRGKGR